jgi:Ran GTPase-activating protein (RanGAP) involved in mRNA processing and transport
MPESVIKRIAEIAERKKQGEDLIFTDRNGNAILNHNVEGNDIATAGVDIETGNETGGDDSSDNQNENENENEK